MKIIKKINDRLYFSVKSNTGHWYLQQHELPHRYSLRAWSIYFTHWDIFETPHGRTLFLNPFTDYFSQKPKS